ncbi:hypothetical protein IWZ03DRAFT_123906 [Phyllosticta citriasiana]|uniref:Kinesin motor domain-containing protein n=1 Tax=Phyllosticta citriasiana TaxID=595635 RepID=A0ABR1K9N8_9PEZI
MSQCVVTRAPAVVQWTPQDGPWHVGLGHPSPQCSILADIKFDSSRNDASLKLQVPVALKETPKKVLLCVLIFPNNIRKVTTPPSADTPAAITNAFVSTVCECSSSQDVLALRILLSDPNGVRIVGPANVKTLTPTKEGQGKILDALRSLSYASEFTVYLPAYVMSSHVRLFCDAASSGKLQPGGSDYALTMMYKGVGGQDISRLLQDTPQSPPPYGASLRSSSTKRPLSCPSSPPGPKRPSSHQDSVSETMPSVMARLVQVELQTSTIQRRLAEQDAAGTPTEIASGADRLEHLDEIVRNLQASMDSLQEEVTQQRIQIEQLQNGLSRQQEACENHQELSRNQIDDYLYECGYEDRRDLVYQIIEDALLDFKREHDDWLQERMDDKLPNMLRAALRTMLPSWLERVQLRVGFNEVGTGRWRWVPAEENSPNSNNDV